MNLYCIRCHHTDWNELLTLGEKLGVVMRPVIDLIFLAFERQHCKTAFESELNRKHLPAEYRQV